MKRVAALWLPDWPIDRLVRAGQIAPPEAQSVAADAAALDPAIAAERRNACSVPRGAGFRPGARWARAEVQAEIDALPPHQRPPARELGRRSEAAENPFRSARGDAGASARDSHGRRPQSEQAALQSGAMFVDRAVPPFSAIRGRAASVPAPATRGAVARVPVVTTLRSGNRIALAATCPAARALGLAPGMALTQARALVPGLAVHPADPEGDAADLRRLAIAAARRWSPVVAIDGNDGLLIDLTGVAHLFGGEAAMAARIVRLLARLGVTARIAIADSAGAAHALVRHGGGDAVSVCPSGASAAALAPLPVAALRIAPDAVELLRRLGVDHVGALAAMPRAPLVRRLGAEPVRRLDQALGHAPEPLDPVIPPEAVRVSRRFAEPIATAEGIARWLGVLAPELTRALEAAGLGARVVLLAATRVDNSVQMVRVGLARASRDGAHLLRLLGRRIETIDPGFGIEALSLHVRRAERLGPVSLVERLDGDAPPDLAPLVDTLATRIGEGRLWRTRAAQSDVPERSVLPAPVLDPPVRADAAGRADDVRRLARAAPPVWHPAWPRPARLLARPEQIDDVMALMPDHPPRRFTWRGETHRIVRADGPERIHGEWWKRLAETHSVRDYFRVEDEQGRRFWLFRRGDGVRGETGDLRWYLHGLFG